MEIKILFFVSFLFFLFHSAAQEKELEVEGGIKIGNINFSSSPEPGMIRWTGKDFEGWNGSDWVSLTGSKTATVEDVEGNVYNTIKIGNQVWMAENLRTRKYRNGALVTLTGSNSTWASDTSGAYCWYDNKDENDKTFGKLYNWFAVNDSRGLCPTGWRVATDFDFVNLMLFLTGESSLALGAIPIVGGMLKQVAYWDAPNYGGTNATGFSGLAGGIRNTAGSFLELGTEGSWWSSGEYSLDTDLAWRLKLVHNSDNASLGVVDKNHGFSVRCVK